MIRNGTALAKAAGLTLAGLKYRMRVYHMTLEQALTLPKHSLWGGKASLRLRVKTSGLARGLRMETVRSRMERNGMDLATAAHLKKHSFYKLNPDCLAQRCIRAGIRYDAAWRRIRRSGWSEEQALNEPVRRYQRHLTPNQNRAIMSAQ